MTDPILYWNEVALEANRIDITSFKEQDGPTLSSRALAIVHLAMYDAFGGTSPGAGLPPYLKPALVAVSGASVDAAVAAAAHSTLGSLFPKQQAFFDSKHLTAGLSGSGLDDGLRYGQEVAAAILKLRKGDPDASDKGWNASMAPGAHRPDPGNPTQGFHAPFYGKKSPGFAITVRHGLAAVSTVTSAEMLAALREVRGKGIAVDGADGGADADRHFLGVRWGGGIRDAAAAL
ncbi:MAG: hypothetical protein NTV52_28210 [Acidobacteria bacterium]|nr:hypothetical protein [Acidobacteriota bacterium]